MNPVVGISIIIPLFGFLLVVWHDRHKRFIVHCDTFRQSLLPVVREINDDPASFRFILNKHFSDQKNAALIFRQHIYGNTRKRFDSAWVKYEQYVDPEGSGYSVLTMFAVDFEDITKANDPVHIQEVANKRKVECLSHLEHLMKFADKK